jgi:hypothetical protein
MVVSDRTDGWAQCVSDVLPPKLNKDDRRCCGRLLFFCASRFGSSSCSDSRQDTLLHTVGHLSLLLHSHSTNSSARNGGPCFIIILLAAKLRALLGRTWSLVRLCQRKFKRDRRQPVPRVASRVLWRLCDALAWCCAIVADRPWSPARHSLKPSSPRGTARRSHVATTAPSSSTPPC